MAKTENTTPRHTATSMRYMELRIKPLILRNLLKV